MSDNNEIFEKPRNEQEAFSMLNSLSDKTHKVLEIGTGTGYQTAIISHLCQKIYTIEIFNKLFNQAKFNIEKLKITNVIYKLGNGINGLEEKIFFDAIIVSAASEEISYQLLKNLKMHMIKICLAN